jgi:hypothetical protein
MSSKEAFMNSPYFSTKHSTYFQVYDELLGQYKGRKITFVEVGVLSGGSLFMWRKFFGPEARIIGVDLNPMAKKWEEFGFEIWIGDQSEPRFWEKLFSQVGEVDILLDDGGHTYKQQSSTCISVLPFLKDGGVLVVEDTHTSYMESFGNRRLNFMKWTYAFIDEMNMRFSGFTGATDKERVSSPVWKVSSYESIVAFHVDRPRAKLVSEVSTNDGVRDSAIDVRFSLESNFVTRAMSRLGRITQLKRLSVLRFLHRLISNSLRMDTRELKVLFKKLETK